MMRRSEHRRTLPWLSRWSNIQEGLAGTIQKPDSRIHMSVCVCVCVTSAACRRNDHFGITTCSQHQCAVSPRWSSSSSAPSLVDRHNHKNKETVTSHNDTRTPTSASAATATAAAITDSRRRGGASAVASERRHDHKYYPSLHHHQHNRTSRRSLPSQALFGEATIVAAE